MSTLAQQQEGCGFAERLYRRHEYSSTARCEQMRLVVVSHEPDRAQALSSYDLDPEIAQIGPRGVLCAPPWICPPLRTIPRTRTSRRLSTSEFLFAESAKSQSTDRNNEASGIARITEMESTKTRLNEIKEELMALLSFGNIEYRRRSVVTRR
ncbi:hypothetical protein V1478_014336 [Vespula squamosa]|uniref:Uncharacterized protein n=1 Tax=Vespula squamosa TaxID=30214 RepID=A0ABD2AAC4_VESSQ